MSFKFGFESRERESQFNAAGGSEFQVRGAAVLNDRLANDATAYINTIKPITAFYVLYCL